MRVLLGSNRHASAAAGGRGKGNMAKEITLIQCGPKTHTCDSDGPEIEIREGRLTGASRTCSVCGNSNFDTDILGAE